MTRRFALHFAFAFNMSKIDRTIHNSQSIIHNYLIENSMSGSGNPRAWTSVPGRFPSFLYNIYRDKRIAAPSQALICEPRSTADLRRFESSVLGFLAVAFPDFFRKEVFLLTCLTFACASVELRQEPLSAFFRKEVFQPHLPVRLPCYDLAPITSFALGRSLR